MLKITKLPEPTDFKNIARKIHSGDNLNIHLAPGGGWAARIHK